MILGHTVERTFAVAHVTFLLHALFEVAHNRSPLVLIKVPVSINIGAQHDVGVQEGFPVSLYGVIERSVPRIELEAAFATESLARRLQRGAGTSIRDFSGNRT